MRASQNTSEERWSSIWAAAEICYPNSCRSRFSGVYLVFEVSQDACRSNKENHRNATLSCPFMASNYANSYLVLISFSSRSGCWECLGFFLSYLVLQACISVCSVSDKSGASMFLPCSHKNAVAHMHTETVGQLWRGSSNFGQTPSNPAKIWLSPVKIQSLTILCHGCKAYPDNSRCFWSEQI